jgi:hypothetical protein
LTVAAVALRFAAVAFSLKSPSSPRFISLYSGGTPVSNGNIKN